MWLCCVTCGLTGSPKILYSPGLAGAVHWNNAIRREKMSGEHFDDLMNLRVFVYFVSTFFGRLMDLFGILPDRCLFASSRTDMRCICLVGRFSIVFGVRVFQQQAPMRCLM